MILLMLTTSAKTKTIPTTAITLKVLKLLLETILPGS